MAFVAYISIPNGPGEPLTLEEGERFDRVSDAWQYLAEDRKQFEFEAGCLEVTKMCFVLINLVAAARHRPEPGFVWKSITCTLPPYVFPNDDGLVYTVRSEP